MFSQGTAALKQQHSNGLEGESLAGKGTAFHLISSMLMAGTELNPLARLQSREEMVNFREAHPRSLHSLTAKQAFHGNANSSPPMEGDKMA